MAKATDEQVEELAKWMGQRAWSVPVPWDALTAQERRFLKGLARHLLDSPPPPLVRLEPTATA